LYYYVMKDSACYHHQHIRISIIYQIIIIVLIIRKHFVRLHNSTLILTGH